MSGNEHNPGAPTGQPEKAKKRQELTEDQRFRMEGRLACGAIFGTDIEYLYETSDKTVFEWEYGGLKPFRPGTDHHLYLRSEVESYFNAKQTFTRREREAERKAAAKKKGSPKTG